MLKFSANLGFLWSDRGLPEAIKAAADAGFSAVECHWPYAHSASVVKAALADTGLQMLSLNTGRGDVAAGENGLASVRGREEEARQAIQQACQYAAVINCSKIHVMAGYSDGGSQAQQVFYDNLQYACDVAQERQQTVLIEPLNHRDVPGYHLSRVEAAVRCIASVDRANLKLMFDCYHVQIMQGDVLTRLRAALPYIGHVQIAAVHDRGEPDRGELNYRFILQELYAMGYSGYVGAEYKPRGDIDKGLSWLQAYS